MAGADPEPSTSAARHPDPRPPAARLRLLHAGGAGGRAVGRPGGDHPAAADAGACSSWARGRTRRASSTAPTSTRATSSWASTASGTAGWRPDMPISGLEDEYELSDGQAAAALRPAHRARPGATARRADRAGCRPRAGRRPRRTTTPSELAERVADDLAVLLTERFAAPLPPVLPGLAAGWLPTPATPLVDRRDELGLVTRPARRSRRPAGDGERAGRHRQDPAGARRGPGAGGRAGRRLVGRPRVAAATPRTCPARSRPPWASRSRAARRCSTRSPTGSPGGGCCCVLDNVEQVLGAAPDLARLLARCPRHPAAGDQPQPAAAAR